jgi:hypothetical protein
MVGPLVFGAHQRANPACAFCFHFEAGLERAQLAGPLASRARLPTGGTRHNVVHPMKQTWSVNIRGANGCSCGKVFEKDRPLPHGVNRTGRLDAQLTSHAARVRL